jgi:hypothetical protein
MKRRLFQVVVVVLMAFAVTVPTAVPASATNPAAVIAVVQKLYDLYKKFTTHDLSLADATQQILAAIESAKTDIIAEIDRVAAAEARACASSAVIDVADIEAFSTDTLQAFARDTTQCVSLIDSLLGSVSDLGAVDELGFALNAVGPVALIARTRAGFSITLLSDTLRHANNTVITRLTPTCFVSPEEPMENGWWIIGVRCQAYNGAVGIAYPFGMYRQPFPPLSSFPGELAASQYDATSATSRAAATAALPLLP